VDVAIVFAFASVIALGLVMNHCHLSPLRGMNGHAMAAQDHATFHPCKALMSRLKREAIKTINAEGCQNGCPTFTF
jgi:hypothetical protein